MLDHLHRHRRQVEHLPPLHPHLGCVRQAGAKPTYKGGVGFVPNLATCDNVDDLLMIDPRPGNATSNDAADNIAVLTAAIAAIPGSYRRRVLVRLDGAGFSHKLLEHIATGGGVKGRSWEFSVGWSCTDREIDAIDATPKAVWQNATDQDGALLDDTWVADITGLLDLSEWTEKTPGLRIIARDEPLHPKYTQRASDREKARGLRFPRFSGVSQDWFDLEDQGGRLCCQHRGSTPMSCASGRFGCIGSPSRGRRSGGWVSS